MGTRSNTNNPQSTLHPIILPSEACDALALITLLLGEFWCIDTANYKHPQISTVLLLILGIVLAANYLRRGAMASWWILGFSTIVGVVNRAGRHAFNGSDVIGTTREAIALVGHGANPYVHNFIYSNPRGAPFPYLPGEIAFYAIAHLTFHQIVGMDKWSGVGIVISLLLLAFSAGPLPAALGTMAYATFEPAVLRSLDGSNDTGLALLVIIAIVLLAVNEHWSNRAAFYSSALFFGWALAFKEFSWLLFPFVVNHLRLRGYTWISYASTALIVAAMFIVPFFAQSPEGFIHNIAGGLTYHHSVFGINIWAAAHTAGFSFDPGIAPLAVVLAIVIVGGVFLFHPAVNLGLALFQGLVVLCTALLCARYATSSYFTFGCAVASAALVLSMDAWRKNFSELE